MNFEGGNLPLGRPGIDGRRLQLKLLHDVFEGPQYRHTRLERNGAGIRWNLRFRLVWYEGDRSRTPQVKNPTLKERGHVGFLPCADR